MPLTASEQRELDELELEKLLAEKASAVATKQPPQAVPAPPQNTKIGFNEYFDMATASPIAPRGAGSFVSGMANLGLRGGLPAAGQAIGAATGPFAPAMVPTLGGALGGIGEALAQFREGKIRPGAILGGVVGGAIPGAPLAKAGVGAVLKEGLRQGVGNVVAKNTETLVDNGRVATLGENTLAGGAGVVGTGLAKGLDKGANAVMLAEALKRSQDATRRQTINLGKELGYVLPPSVLRPNPGNNLLNSVGGKAAMAQEAMLRNQPITNKAVREELGLPADTALSPPALNAARVGPNSVYGEVSALSPQTAIMLDDFKQAQSDANTLFTTYRNQFPKDPSVLVAAKQRQVDADDAIKMIEKEAATLKAGDIVDRFKEARIKLAKVGLAERALNKGDGNIDAKVIGDAYDAGEKLTGNFEKIGRFQNAFSSALREASKVPPSGVNQLLPVLAGGAGAMTHGVPGVVAATAATLAAPPLARQFGLSRMVQKNLVPSYGPQRQDMAAMLARFAANAAGRQDGEPDPAQYIRRR